MAMAASPSRRSKTQAVATVADVLGPQARRLARRDRPGVDRLPGQCRRQLHALRVVEIDDRRLQPRPREQLRLGLPVGVHVAVVVEMVLREVGEDRDGHARAVEAMLGDADRRRLDRAGEEAAVGEIGERGLQGDRVGRGQAGRVGHVRRRLGTGRGARRHADAERADDRRAPTGHASACASHQAVDVLPLVPVTATTASARSACRESGGDVAGGGLQPAYAATRGSPSKPKAATPSASTRQATAPARARRARRPAAIGGVAGPGDEAVAGADGAAVAEQAARPAQQQPGWAASRESSVVSACRPSEALVLGGHVVRDDLRLDVEVGRHAHHAQRLLHDLR